MKAKSIVKASLSISTASLICTSIFSLGNAQENINPSEAGKSGTVEVTFYCGAISDRESEEQIPATLAYVPLRQVNIAIIAWKNKHLANWNPLLSCKEVSQNFQTFYENNRLNYLSNGENAGYPIICAIADKQEQCNEENQLFQVRPGSNPEDVVSGLKEILEGKSSPEPIYQNSGDRVYISVSEFLENAPAIEDETLTSN